MIRLIVYFVFVAAVATGLAWFADRPGNLKVEWLGEEVQTTVFIAVLILIVVFVAIVLAVWLGILTLTAPRRIARRMKARRTRIGNEAVRRGIFAAGAGDRLAALRAGAIAKKNVPDEPLALLLEAQSAQLNEDAIASRQAFERMLGQPGMSELGLRGLYMEAKKAGQEEAARQFAEKALAANPALTWSSAALFELQCKEEDWRAALKTLGIAKQHRHLPKTEADRRRALLLTALAAELEDTQQGKALAYAVEANSIMPSLVPAAVIAGRVLAAQGNVNRATKILAQVWRAAPHPDLALIYAHARTGDSPRDRLQRVKSLVASCPASLEGDIAVAIAAIEAKDWASARAALEPHLGDNPQARVYRLMARLEAGQNRDSGRAREWLAKAARAAPDPAWVAADGSVSPEWHPRSPLSGALGAFEWKAPASGPGLFDADDMMPEMAALDLQPAEPLNAPFDFTATKTINERAPVNFSGPPRPADAAGSSPINEAAKPAAAELKPDLAAQNATPESSTPESVKHPGADNEAQTTPTALGVEKAPKPVSPFAYEAAPPDQRPIPEWQPAAKVVEQQERPKADIRKPKIFVPDRPPDDPGPRAADGEDGSTPLSRFRGPS